MDLDRFFTRLNPIFVAIGRTPLLHWLQSPFLIVVTVTGRRTGRRYTIPLGYQIYGDRIVTLVSKARRKNWWRNYIDPAPVEIVLRGRTIAAEGEVLAPDGEDFRNYAERTFRRLPWLGPQFGVTYDRSTGLSDEQVAHLGREAAIVRFSPSSS
jgi:hypothetical protein